MQKKKVTFKNRLEYLLFMLYIWNIKLSPLSFMSLHRKCLLFLFKILSKKHKEIVLNNLTTAFPDKTSEEILKLKDKIYEHFSTVFTQIMFLYVKKKPEKILPDITIHNIHIIKNILKRGKGVILFTAHFGNWELMPFIVKRELNIISYNVAREMDNPLIEKKVKDFRTYMGSRIIYKKGSIKTILKELKNNNIIGLIIDQNTLPQEGVFVDFFSHKVCAIPSYSQLHLKRDIPIAPVFLHYEPGRIVFEIMEEITFQKTDDYENDVLQFTQLCNSIIEAKIRQFPEQWFWFHNRWKTQPQGEIHEKR